MNNKILIASLNPQGKFNLYNTQQNNPSKPFSISPHRRVSSFSKTCSKPTLKERNPLIGKRQYNVDNEFKDIPIKEAITRFYKNFGIINQVYRKGMEKYMPKNASANISVETQDDNTLEHCQSLNKNINHEKHREQFSQASPKNKSEITNLITTEGNHTRILSRKTINVMEIRNNSVKRKNKISCITKYYSKHKSNYKKRINVFISKCGEADALISNLGIDEINKLNSDKQPKRFAWAINKYLEQIASKKLNKIKNIDSLQRRDRKSVV